MATKKVERSDINDYIKKNKKYLSIQQLAENCGISVRAVQHRCERMGLPFRKEDREWFRQLCFLGLP